MKLIAQLVMWFFYGLFLSAYEKLTIKRGMLYRAVIRQSAHVVQEENPGAFPELAPGLMVIITVCTAFVSVASIVFATYGQPEALLLVPVFVAWVFFVLLYRAIKFRVLGLIS